MPKIIHKRRTRYHLRGTLCLASVRSVEHFVSAWDLPAIGCLRLQQENQPDCRTERNSLKFKSGSEKGVFWKRGLFRKVHFLEILENLETLEILENPQTLENKGESDHFLENLEILEIPEIPPVKRPLS